MIKSIKPKKTLEKCFVMNEFQKSIKEEIKQLEDLVIPSPEKPINLEENECVVGLLFDWRLTRNQVAELIHSINDCLLNVYEINDKSCKVGILFNGDLTKIDILESELIRLKNLE